MTNRRAHLATSLICLVSALFACAPTEQATGNSTPRGGRLLGTWRAVLASPGGELPFTLEIAEIAGELSAVAISGDERAPFSEVTGRWHKTIPGGVSGLDFQATKGDPERFRSATGVAEPSAPTDISGVWRVEFVDDSGTELAQGEFRQKGSRVEGTFLTPVGDYRFLEGSFENGLLRLSTFDGGHAFLFHARATEDGALSGDFWSRDTYHATWTATRADDSEPVLPDAWELAGLTNDEGLFRFAFPDLDGQLVTDDDPSFEGKVVIANIFGSWCPNCNDKAPLLGEWDRRYRDRGLALVGLAYEFSGDPDRDALYVRKYAERHGIEFPLLLAGISDKQAAAETLPDLTSVVAFPTSVFIGRDGKVRRIHSGFAGPGTGEHHDDLVAELEGLIESLLAEEI
jgi:thiol-disulfide isomerase/thioredoxin